MEVGSNTNTTIFLFRCTFLLAEADAVILVAELRSSLKVVGLEAAAFTGEELGAAIRGTEVKIY